MGTFCSIVPDPANQANARIDRETELWRWINMRGGLRYVCPGKQYAEPPWVKMPADGRRYSKIGSITLPANDGLDHVVQTFFVPLGYDGVIISTVFNYTGIGFAEGSGDLSFRIQINQRYARDYGNIQTSIGSLVTPYNINSGQVFLLSGQRVQLVVNRSVASGGNLNGGRIIAAAFGWFYPR